VGGSGSVWSLVIVNANKKEKKQKQDHLKDECSNGSNNHV